MPFQRFYINRLLLIAFSILMLSSKTNLKSQIIFFFHFLLFSSVPAIAYHHVKKKIFFLSWLWIFSYSSWFIWGWWLVVGDWKWVPARERCEKSIKIDDLDYLNRWCHVALRKLWDSFLLYFFLLLLFASPISRLLLFLR